MTDDPRPKRPGSHWGEVERDAVGREHRRRASAFGVPIVVAAPAPAAEIDNDGTPTGDPASSSEGDAITSPIDLLLRDLTADEQQLCDEITVANEQRVSADSPVTLGQFVKLVARVNDVKREERRARRDSANRDLEIVGKKGPPLERLSALERKMRIVWALLGAAATAASGSLITVGKGLYERGADEGALKIRLDHYERDNERLRLELRDLRDRVDDRRAPRSDRSGWLTPATPLPAPKETDKP